MAPGTKTGSSRLMTMRATSPRTSKRIRRATTSMAPKIPKIAPEAPTDGWSGELNR